MVGKYKMCYGGEETWNLPWRKKDLLLTMIGKYEIHYDGEET